MFLFLVFTIGLHIWVYIHTYIHIYIDVFMYACIYVCIYMYICMWVYIITCFFLSFSFLFFYFFLFWSQLECLWRNQTNAHSLVCEDASLQIWVHRLNLQHHMECTRVYILTKTRHLDYNLQKFTKIYNLQLI